ncbi:MAG: phosphoribosyltransferase family protein, partial [Sulfolobales archaeon]
INSVEAVGVKFYKGIGEHHEKPIITHPLTADVNEKKILIVDDVADSGKTLQIAIELLQLYGPKEIKTSSIYIKPTTIVVPDFYVAETDSWIIFPWEYAEVLRNIIKSKGLTLNENSLNKVVEEIGIERDTFINELLVLLSKTPKNFN